MSLSEFNLDFLITVAAIVPSISLGAMVYFRGGRTIRERLFFGATAVLIVWAIVNYFSLQNDVLVLFWIRLVLFFAVLLNYLFFYVVYTLPKHYTPLKAWQNIALAFMATATMFVTQTPLVFESAVARNGQVMPVPGKLIFLFGLTVFFFFVLGGLYIVRKSRSASAGERRQLFFIGIGYFVMFALLIFTQFVATAVFDNTYFVRFGPLFTLPFLLSTTYAILRHNLFNLRVVATEIFIGVMIIIFMLNAVMSETIERLVINIVLLLAVAGTGLLLIRSILKEIHVREEIEQLAGKLARANARLRELDKLKSEFISLASHQLRTPITPIKWYASLILDGTYGKISKEIRSAAQNIYASGHSLALMVDDFLNVSRIEGGRLTYNFEVVDMAVIIGEIVAAQQPAIETAKLRLVVKLGRKDSCYVSVDKEKIHQVLTNVVDNAIKYTPEGSITITLQKDSTEHVRVTVRDTGLGIAADVLPTLFVKFRRAPSVVAKNIAGSGLGLYFAKEVVNAHHGTLRVESKGEGKGTTLILELPAAKPTLVPRKKSARSLQKGAGSAVLSLENVEGDATTASVEQ